jgi:hypothetical protein
MNTFITPNWVTTDTAMNWLNNIKFVGRMSREYGSAWKDKPDGAQIGATVQVRLPQKWEVTEGQALQQQAILNQTVPVSITTQLQIGMGWSSSESALEVEMVQERYTKPAARAMGNKCDKFAAQQVYQSVYFSIGSPGTPISSNDDWLNAVALMRNVGVPEELCAVVDPKTMAKLMSTNQTLFNPSAYLSEVYKSGKFSGPALGIDDWYYDPNMPTHTTGSFTSSTPAVVGAGQTGSTLSIDGMGTYAFKAGDVFTLDGVYAVNPLSFINTNELQQFVITTDISGSSTATLPISPSIITSGALQTVTNSPANDAAVSFLGATGTVGATMTATTSRQSIVFNPAAFAWVSADLPVNLAGAVAGRTSDPEARLSMRYVDQYNIQTDQLPRRIDMLVGAAPVLPYFAFRAWS